MMVAGRGAYSTVRLAWNERVRRLVAVKLVDRTLVMQVCFLVSTLN